MLRKKHTMKILLNILLLLCSLPAFAGDTIIIHKDPRLDILQPKQAEMNKRNSLRTASGLYKGFRLQVLNTRSREEAFKLKGELLQLFPDQKTYTIFQSPFFKVRIGNFLERADADAFRKLLARQYKGTTYIIEDMVEYEPTEEETAR